MVGGQRLAGILYVAVIFFGAGGMQDQIYLGYLTFEVNALLWLPSQVPVNELPSGSIGTHVPPN